MLPVKLVSIHARLTEVPWTQIPIQIDIIKHRHEIDGKSTAAHAAILSPNHVKVYEYPAIPDYSTEEGVVLIFPSHHSCSIASLFNQANHERRPNHQFDVPKGKNLGTLLRYELHKTNNEHNIDDNGVAKNVPYDFDSLPVKRAVFIDSTWNQCRGIYKDDRINSLKSVVLQNRLSQFWRHHQGSPRWYLSTIEAIHQFLIEVHIRAWGLDAQYRGLDRLELSAEFLDSVKNRGESGGCAEDAAKPRPYSGQYDNLLFFFTHMYDLIHTYYDHNELKSYKRPQN